MADEKKTLKPCPFCGENKVSFQVDFWDITPIYHFECIDCSMTVYSNQWRNKQEAERAWNRRAEGIEELNAIPAADVVKVIRCKECEHFTKDMAVGICYRNPGSPILPMHYDNYCGFAKRRGRE